MKVVVAEVDPVLRQDLQLKFEAWGHEIVVVEDGQEAMQAIWRLRPDMVILDWELPTLDGLDICSKIRDCEKLPYIYIIMLTEKSHDDYMMAGFSVGVDDFIVKPVDDVIVQSRIVVGTRIAAYERALSKRTEQLKQRSEHLEELAETRAHQLILAERMATMAMLSADSDAHIEDPMASLADNIDDLETTWSEVLSLLSGHVPAGPDRERLDRANGEIDAAVQKIRDGLEPISNIKFRLMAHRFEQSGGTVIDSAGD